jgi:DNA-binding NarL/FixJ family response regulator
MPDKTNVIIIDDHSTTLTGIKNIVEEIQFVEVIGTGCNGKEALELLEKHKINLLITDVEMENIDGIELSKIVKNKYPGIKIIIVTMHSARWKIAKLMEQDIDAIVLKSKIDYEEIRIAIQKVRSGERFYSPEIKDLFFEEKPSVQNVPNLTTREKEILICTCQGLTIKEIAGKLYIADCTVQTHRKNLLIKLKVKNQLGLVREAIRYGFYNFE